MFPGLWSREEKVHVCSERERGRERGEKERVGWAFLSSLQEHKGQSNTSSGVVAKTANLALFLLLFFTIAVCESLFASRSLTVSQNTN